MFILNVQIYEVTSLYFQRRAKKALARNPGNIYVQTGRLLSVLRKPHAKQATKF